jgi:hypothetical protein
MQMLGGAAMAYNVGGAPMAFAGGGAPLAYSIPRQVTKVSKVKEEKKLNDPDLIALESEISSLVDPKNNRFQTSFIKNYKHLLLFKQVHGNVKVTATSFVIKQAAVVVLYVCARTMTV